MTTEQPDPGASRWLRSTDESTTASIDGSSHCIIDICARLTGPACAVGRCSGDDRTDKDCHEQAWMFHVIVVEGRGDYAGPPAVATLPIGEHPT